MMKRVTKSKRNKIEGQTLAALFILRSSAVHKLRYLVNIAVTPAGGYMLSSTEGIFDRELEI